MPRGKRADHERTGHTIGTLLCGKNPLFLKLSTFYPHLAGRLVKVAPYDSRDPRPGEQDGVDYHFRPREVIGDIVAGGLEV